MRRTVISILVLMNAMSVPADTEPTAVPTELVPEPETVPARPLALSKSDYSYAYWLNSFLKPKGDKSENILCLETGHYGFMLNVTDISKPRFGLLQDDTDYPSALESGSARLQDLAPAELNVTLEQAGTTYRMVGCRAAEGRPGDVRQWESGQVAQHYDVLGLVFEDESGERVGCFGTLDMVAWPDSLTFNVELAPEYVYADGASEGVVGNGQCVFEHAREIPHADRLDPETLTVECWVKSPEALPQPHGWLLCKNNNEWAEGNFGFGSGAWAPSATMNIGGGRENQHSIGMHGHHYKKDDWNHLALTCDGNERKRRSGC